jgi:hypothetical protein
MSIFQEVYLRLIAKRQNVLAMASVDGEQTRSRNGNVSIRARLSTDRVRVETVERWGGHRTMTGGSQ